jgi:hypothetical protein
VVWPRVLSQASGPKDNLAISTKVPVGVSETLEDFVTNVKDRKGVVERMLQQCSRMESYSLTTVIRHEIEWVQSRGAGILNLIRDKVSAEPDGAAKSIYRSVLVPDDCGMPPWLLLDR